MKGANQIIYYDVDSNLNYSIFYLTGFLQNAEIFDYKFIISKAAPPLLSDPIMGGEWKRILFSICLFKVKASNEEFYFCIDARDSCEADPNRGRGYHLPLLKKVKYYFKVNYNKDAINNNLNLRAFANKIIPVLPFFPVRLSRLLPYLPLVIPSSIAGRAIKDSGKRLEHLNNILTLQQIKQMRNFNKNLDIFFVMRFYNEKAHSADNEFRYQIMKEVQKYRHINSLVGFASQKEIPGKYADFQLRGYALKQYLECIARSKIGIYVRGLHDCLSFKFGQLLSLGMPIVGQTIHNNKDNIMDNKYFHEQFAFDDPKEIAQQAVKLLNEPEKMTTIGTSNAEAYDAKYTPKRVVSDILECLII